MLRTCFIAVIVSALWACAPEPPPPVFASLTLAQAKAQVAGTPRVLIVKATASWCPPCKAMNKTSWRDPRIERWVADHGLAIELDTDAHPDEARALHITALPTMIAFKNGEEFDRVAGALDPDQLAAWLEAVGRGERAGLERRGR